MSQPALDISSHLSEIEPAKPIAPWRGGKMRIHGQIISRICRIPHRCYAEPFLGMGGIFLRRRWRPESEIINDLNRDIYTLFLCAREHPDELARQLRFVLPSRADFERLEMKFHSAWSTPGP